VSIKKFYSIAFFCLLFLNLFFLTAIISYQITLHGELVNIPDLEGKTMEEARALLTDKKLTVVQSGLRLHDRYEAGKIILQEPEADVRVKLYQEIHVILSAGMEKVVVPDLRNRMFQAVGPELQEIGLQRGGDSHVYSAQYSAGKIIAHNPLPGEEVPKGSRISCLVSEGERNERRIMPDLIGKKASVVIPQLEAKGYRIADLREITYRFIESGIIIRQDPLQGSPVQIKTLIYLEVSK
jgi:beta-lactam-binding protein with PASTA domain